MSTSDCENESNIYWKVNPVSANEQKLFYKLIRKGEYQTRGLNLPSNRQNEIENAARSIGMDLYQALSLRRQILRWKYRQHSETLVNHPEQAKYAKSFESLIFDFLVNVKKVNASNILTEENLKDAKMKLTPDIVFKTRISINGRLVHWIDCKAYFASIMILKDAKCNNAPVNKVAKQIARYNTEYGSGAVVFLRGFHIGIANEWKNCLLLDCTEVDISIFNVSQ